MLDPFPHSKQAKVVLENTASQNCISAVQNCCQNPDLFPKCAPATRFDVAPEKPNGPPEPYGENNSEACNMQKSQIRRSTHNRALNELADPKSSALAGQIGFPNFAPRGWPTHPSKQPIAHAKSAASPKSTPKFPRNTYPWPAWTFSPPTERSPAPMAKNNGAKPDVYGWLGGTIGHDTKRKVVVFEAPTLNMSLAVAKWPSHTLPRIAI